MANLPLVDIPNAVVAHGILAGGRVSEDALRAIAAAGYTTVINLQAESEPGVARERELASELGLTYLSIPVAGPAGVTRENAAALDAALAAAEGATVVHCAGGNRVGALMALRAHASGASPDDAVRVGRETGLTGLEPVVRRVIDGVGVPLADPNDSGG